MGRKSVGPVCCVMHLKEPRTLIMKRRGLPRCFWICALNTQQGGYVRATNLLYYYYYYIVMKLSQFSFMIYLMRTAMNIHVVSKNH